jgi:CubicO group peptidase (beta-lactamase class C family)
MKRLCFILLGMVATCGFGISTASSQYLTDESVEKLAAPLMDKPSNLTLYEIGSVSKVFTSLLLAHAVVQGKIDLAAAAATTNASGIRLPARDGRSITWLDLSTHRSGLPRLPTNLPLTDLTDPYAKYNSSKAAEFFDKYELLHAPGETQEYSNLAVSVLGYLIAEKAGMSYQRLLREAIADPLKMTDCTVSLTSDQVKRHATPHSAFNTEASLWTFADLPGAGGIHATLRDMMRFARAQLTPPTGPLGEAIELAWKQQTAADASGAAMGLGWMIAGDGQTRWHNGQTGGFHAALFINRDLRCAIIILCNTATDEVDKLAMQLLLKGAGREPKSDPKDDPAKGKNPPGVDAELRARLVGRYELNPNFIFDVRDRDGHLMVGITNQATQEVYPDSPSRWSYRGVDATLEFKLTKTGPAKSLILHQNGIQQTAKRIDK